MSNPKGEALTSTAALALAIGIYFWICHLGMIQFGGMDGGVLSSAAWQMHLGYQPYRDFITAVPPFFLIGAKLAFQWFGVEWRSFVRLAAWHSAITLVLHYWLARSVFPRWWSLSLAVVTQLLTAPIVSFWWYNPITQIQGVLFFTATLAWKLAPSRRTEVLWVLTGALLLLCKVNMAVSLMGLTMLSLLLFPPPGRNRARIAGLFALAASLAVLLLIVSGISPARMAANYALGRSRANLSTILDNLFLNQAWEVKQSAVFLLPVCAALAIWLWAHCSLRKPLTWFDLELHFSRDEWQCLPLAATSLATTLFTTATNNSFNMQELPIALTGIAFLLVHVWPETPRRLRSAAQTLLALAILGLSFHAALISQLRLGIMEVGPGMFYENNAKPMRSPPAFFAGLSAGPMLNRTLRDMDAALDLCQCRNGQVFFGPRLDWAYPAYGIKPLRGLPLWWELPEGSSEKYERRFLALDLDMAVFHGDDYTFMPDTLVKSIQTKFYRRRVGGLITYLKKR